MSNLRDIFEKAKTYGSFNNWLTNVPEEDLLYLSDIMDKVSDDKLKTDEDLDSFQQIVAIAMFFSGKHEASEEEVEDLCQSMAVYISCECNVRKGDMTKEGIYSLVPGEDTAKYKITPQGAENVRNMLKDNSR